MTEDASWLDRAVDELYAGDLDQFTPRRTELAKEARAAGDKDAAKEITGLRKPTQSAFTINRLARTDPSAIEGLIDVGAELRQAQRSADGKQLRDLNSQRRKVLDSLTKRAFEIIGQQSPSAGQREEVNATLMAALADPAVAEQLQQGILVRAAESSGFGFSPPELTLIRSPARPKETPDPGEKQDAAEQKAPAEKASPSATSAAPTKAASRPTADDAAKRRAQEAADEEERRAAARAAEEERRQAAKDKAIARAQADADDADTAVHEAVTSIEGSQQLIKLLQRQLSEARRVLEDAQKQAKVAEARQKKAREALNKAKG